MNSIHGYLPSLQSVPFSSKHETLLPKHQSTALVNGDRYLAPSRQARQPDVRIPVPSICREFPGDWNVGSIWREGSSHRYPAYIPSRTFDPMLDYLLSGRCGTQLVRIGTFQNGLSLYMLRSDALQLNREGGSHELNYDFPNGVRVR